MTKKFLGVTLALVIAVGFVTVVGDERPLVGTWENELILDPDKYTTFAAYNSLLSIEYTTGGLSYSSDTTLDLSGLTEQEVGVETTLGLLSLSSKLNLDVDSGNLRFWKSSVALDLGGVAISSTLYLQKHDWSWSDPGYKATFWPEVSDVVEPHGFESLAEPTQTDSYIIPYKKVPIKIEDEVGCKEYTGDAVDNFQNYGAGFELGFSGETPGGISISVTNTFGMMPTGDAESELTGMLEDEVKEFIEDQFSDVDNFANDWEDEISLNDIRTELESGTWPFSAVPVVGPWFAIKFDVPAVGDVELFNSTKEGSAVSDPTTLESLAVDFWAYVKDKEAKSTYDRDDPEFSVSKKARKAYLNALKASISINGIAGETGKVVNTEFDLGGAQYDWTIMEADKARGTDASVSFGLENVAVGPGGTYNGSSLQYYSTLLEIDNLSFGCCDFSNETKFTGHDGFEYTEIDFNIANKDFPIDIDATLKWDYDPDTDDTGKVVTLTPSLSTDWSCFEVYTDLTLTTSSDSTVVEGLEIEGFRVSAKLGHVKVTSLTALNTLNGVYSLDSRFHGYDEVLSIEKLESAGDLDFKLDYYTNLGSAGNGLMPVALEGTASYPISSQFDLGSSLAWTHVGLQKVGLTFDYSF